MGYEARQPSLHFLFILALLEVTKLAAYAINEGTAHQYFVVRNCNFNYRYI
jgi:hypothetical protein